MHALVSRLSCRRRSGFSTCSPGIPRPCVQGALALQGMLRGGEETPVFCQRVNQFENDADNITREVLTAVRRTFITPFDRGDIKNLITSMDDAIDQMQQTAKAVILFEVRTFEPPMREIGTLLVECANLVGRALPLMQSIGDNVAMLTAITEELDQAGRPGRRSPRHRPERAVPQAPQRQHDGFHRRRGDLRPSRKSRRPLRRRRQRDQQHRDRTGIGQGRAVDATLGLPILVGLIAVALLFDFLNGLHDAANSIATIVSTRVLRPQYAVLWAAFFNFVAFLVFGLHVANTIGTGIIEPSIIDAQVIFGALVGAIVWNLITWGLGIPSSSSHALIGGLVGAGMAKAGISAAVWSGLTKTLLAIVLSPLVGFLLALVLVAIVSWLSVRSTPFAVDRAFRILQFVSASLYSLGHGGNDAQKTMGIIAVLLYSQGHLGEQILDSVLGGAGLPGRDGAGHADGRLADRAHHGTADHQADADAGLLRRDRRRGDAVHGDLCSGFRSRPPTPSPARSSASARRAGSRRCAGTWRARSSMPG